MSAAMVSLVVKECSLCGGTGWQVVERGGLSGAQKCVCAGGEPKWWRFRTVVYQKHGPPKFGKWIYFLFSGPNSEASQIAREALDGGRFAMECLGLERPERVASTAFQQRGTLSFYMEKF